MTDETFPHEIWADLDHWIEGPAASDLRAQGYMKYIRADHVDALLKAERERVLRKVAIELECNWGHIATPEMRKAILALPSEDATDG